MEAEELTKYQIAAVRTMNMLVGITLKLATSTAG